jgi:Protein of unknown function (DUF4232)
MAARQGEDAVPPPCGSDDLAVEVRWSRDGTGLRGQVVATNVGDRACRLANKPTVTPLRPDGSSLPVTTVITLEWVSPGYVILHPGQRAAAPLRWASWCGQQASGRARVEWGEGSAIAGVTGPAQPDCDSGRGGNITSSWFKLI